MPNKITYTITTADGKSHQVNEENIKKYGINSYAEAYAGATIRMRDNNNADYYIPLSHYDDAKAQGLRPFRLGHTAAKPRQTVKAPRNNNNLSQRITRPAQRPASQAAPRVAQPATSPAAPSTPTTNYTGPLAKQEPFKGLDVEPSVEYNQKTGSFTPSNKHKYTSEVKPTAKKQSTTPLQDAIADKERLSKMMEARMRELEQQQQDMPWWQQLGSAGKTGMGADMNYEAISNDCLMMMNTSSCRLPTMRQTDEYVIYKHCKTKTAFGPH